MLFFGVTIDWYWIYLDLSLKSSIEIDIIDLFIGSMDLSLEFDLKPEKIMHEKKQRHKIICKTNKNIKITSKYVKIETKLAKLWENYAKIGTQKRNYQLEQNSQYPVKVQTTKTWNKLRKIK